MNVLSEGLTNWKLRLILSALLCMMGLAAMTSMLLGLFLELTVFDKTIVAIAVFMVGVPTYLILSRLASIDEHTIAIFLNEQVDELSANPEVLVKKEIELTDEERTMRDQLLAIFSEKPVYQFLPDKPVKQAYFLMLSSLVVSFLIWFLG
ncbi:MAG: hypothetical protein JJ971_05625 [Balneolaceae bacterium]|nr:hypothetical protein [Balneolaceae bacterium]MBO6545857.1 hypothetical protein [Balneolaceae bacterium]MBO6647253.1 hypothetical protein [Balneolaceae bacterium]